MEIKNEEQLKMALMSRHADVERGWKETQSKILRSNRNRLFRRGVSAVAAVAAVAILTIFIFSPGNDLPQNISVISAEPGRNQAMLIMSDGSKVTLTDSSDIKITDVSGASISVVEGKTINYENTNIVKSQSAINTIVVPRAGIYSLTLSDGTKVWINSESKLSYPVAFNGEKREVTLSGEAYFEVAHNKNHPFIVHCNGNRVEVTGTEFNTEAYEGGKTTTTLVSGGVVLTGNSGSVILTLGMQGIISGNEISTLSVNANQFSSWKDGLFEFDNITLGDIVMKLSRWYDVDFVFEDASLANFTFTATFPKNENLSFIVKLIERISSAQFSLTDGKVVVSSKK